MGDRPTSNLADLLAEGSTDSLFFRGLELLQRPQKGIFGGISAITKGEDPLAAAFRAFTTGEDEGSRGKDILQTLFGADPESKLTQAAGFAGEVILDPLNLIGIGALTKGGKAAKALRGLEGVEKLGDAAQLARGLRSAKLGSTIGEQARLGQRGLLTAGGRKIPVPGGDIALEALGKGGSALRQAPGFRQAADVIQSKFGGRFGEIRVLFGDTIADQIAGADTASGRLVRAFITRTTPLIKRIRTNLNAEEASELTETIARIGKSGDQQGELLRFIGGSESRQKAVEAAKELQIEMAGFTQANLGEFGLGGLTGEDLSFLPRVLETSFDAPKKIGGQTIVEEIPLTGQSDNAINRMQMPQSTRADIQTALLDEEGRALLNSEGTVGVINGQQVTMKEAFGAAFDNVPGASTIRKAFLQRHRVSQAEGNELFEQAATGTSFKTSAPVLFQHMQRQAADNVKADALVRSLEDAGIAVPYDEALHGGLREGQFVRVDQGRFAQSPLALPIDYDRAFNKFMEVNMPGPDKSLFGLLPWFKGGAITGFGLNIPAFVARNVTTALQKNYYEGLGPTSFKGLDQSRRFYTAGWKLTWETHNFKLNPNRTLDDVVDLIDPNGFTTIGGTRVNNRWLIGEYVNRDFSGMQGARAASRAPELSDTESARFFDKLFRPGAERELREKVFAPSTGVIGRSEMFIRLPLMMKMMEDTFDAARKLGIEVPTEILADAAPRIGDLVDIAVTNAKERVLFAHFDYSDLSTFEQKIRAKWIPFYTWMRKNIPNETINLITQPGKFAPLAKAYYRAFESQEIRPEDLPPWAGRSFAFPITPDEDGRLRWIDMTSFMPTADLVEFGRTAAVAVPFVGAGPEFGKTRQGEVLRYIATRFNPFPIQAAEQLFGKDVFTGREFRGEFPQEVFGLPVGGDTANLLDLFPTLRRIDRINPFGVFGETPRPHRNEPQDLERFLRALTGITIRSADPDQANRTRKVVKRNIGRLRSRLRRERRDGNTALADFLLREIQQEEERL